MKKLRIFTMCALLVGVVACYGQNGKKTKKQIESTKTDTRDGDYGKKTPAIDNGLDNTTSPKDWDRDYDKNMDISPMYDDLEMTDQQIKDYESNKNSYRNRYNKNRDGKSPDNQAILIQKDSSLQSVLTPEQYKKYKEMDKKRKNNNK